MQMYLLAPKPDLVLQQAANVLEGVREDMLREAILLVLASEMLSQSRQQIHFLGEILTNMGL